METIYTATAKSPRYGDIPLGRFGSLEEAEAHAKALIPGTMFTIFRHDGPVSQKVMNRVIRCSA